MLGGIDRIPASPPARRPVGRPLPTLLLLLTVFGPISMDLYLPALPALTAELGAVDLGGAADRDRLRLVGLAARPADRRSRCRTASAPRHPRCIGVAAYVATSALCARQSDGRAADRRALVQGLAGGVGIVIAQAAGRDVYSGGALIRFYGRLTVIGGLAAIVGPLLGGLLIDGHRLARTVRRSSPAIGGGILARRRPGRVPRDLRLAPDRAAGLAQTDARLPDPRVRRMPRSSGAVLNQGFALRRAVRVPQRVRRFVLQDIYGLSPARATRSRSG